MDQSGIGDGDAKAESGLETVAGYCFQFPMGGSLPLPKVLLAHFQRIGFGAIMDRPWFYVRYLPRGHWRARQLAPGAGKLATDIEKVRIREYRPQDFQDLWRLDQVCFPPQIAYSRFELMRYIRRKGAFALVAESSGNLRGFVVAEVRPVRPRRALGARCGEQSKSPGAAVVAGSGAERLAGHIITVDVGPDARRGGVGTLLMDAAEDRLQRDGCDVVYLETAVNNHAAIAFYKGRGYSVLNVIPRYYSDELDALMMGKALRSKKA